jgi:hypothetical protein
MFAGDVGQHLFRVFSGQQGFGKFFERGYERIHNGLSRGFIVNGW